MSGLGLTSSGEAGGSGRIRSSGSRGKGQVTGGGGGGKARLLHKQGMEAKEKM